VRHCGSAILAKHTPATIHRRVRVTGITAGDGKAIQDCRLIDVAARNNVAAVLRPVRLVHQIVRIVYLDIVTVEVTAEDSLVSLDVAGIGVWFTEAGVAPSNCCAVDQLERSFPVARSNSGSLVRSVHALGYPDFVAVPSGLESVLKASVGIGPT
jgi:hypothetical protein